MTSRAVKRPPKKAAKKTPSWAVKAATEIEGQATQEAVAAEVTAVRSKTSTTRPKGKTKPRKKEPFHFSPIKTPPAGPSSAAQQVRLILFSGV